MVRPTAVRGALLLALAGAGGATAFLLTSSASAATTCNISWSTATSGTWSNAANWTDSTSAHRVPTSGDVVCITVAGTYTVTMDGSQQAASVSVGGSSGTATLLLPSQNTSLTLTADSTIGVHGALTLGDSGSGYSILQANGTTMDNKGKITTVQGTGDARYLRASVTNEASATVEIGSADTRMDSSGGATLLTNSGTVKVDAPVGGSSPYTPSLVVSSGSSFTNTAGTVTNGGSLVVTSGTFTERGGSVTGNAVAVNSSTLDDDTSAGTGPFLLTGGATLTGTGTHPGVASGQTVTLGSSNSLTAVGSNLTDAGTIAVGDAGGGYSGLQGSSFGITVTPTGTLSTLFGGGDTRYLRTGITNNGTVLVGGPTLTDSSGGATLVTNNATLTVQAGANWDVKGSSSFSNLGGTVTNNGALTLESGTFTERAGTLTGSAAVLSNSTLDDDTTAALSSFLLSGSNTLTGTASSPGVAAGQVVTVDGSGAITTLAMSISNAGTITLGNAGGGYSQLVGAAFTVSNTGTLQTVLGGGGTRYLRTSVVNTGTVSLDGQVTTDSSGGATLFTNKGTTTVKATGAWALSGGAAFANTSGSLNDQGALSVSSGTFTQRAAKITGNPVTLTSSTLDDDTTSAAAAFLMTGSNTLTGTGPSPGTSAGQTITVDASGAELDLGLSLTNAGKIVLGNAGGNYALLVGAAYTVTNTGQINTVAGGGGNRYLRTSVINKGTMDLAGAILSDSGGGAITLTNAGTTTIEPGAEYDVSGSSTIVNTGGTITNNGILTVSNGSFTERGGSTTGVPITLTSSTLDDDLTAAAARFVLNTSNTITGSGSKPGIASGQVVTLASSGGSTSLGTDLTNAGTLNLGDSGSNYALLQGAANTLTNTGTLNVVGGGGGIRYLRTNITNNGTVDEASTDFRQDSAGGATTFLNNGTYTVEDKAVHAISGPSAFTQSSTGTYATVVNGTATTNGSLTGGTVSLAGTLKVNTIGAVAVASSWPIISSSTVSGTFSTFKVTPNAYYINYTPTAVTLTAVKPYTVAASAVSAKAGISTGTITVGTLTDTGKDSTSTTPYTATISWGDGTAASTGTITYASGSSYSITGSHTYATKGSYTVTVTVTEQNAATGLVNGESASATSTATVDQVPAFSASSPPDSAVINVAYSYTFTASGSPAPTFSVASGTLPAGLTLNSTSGVLSGTPTTVAPYTFAIKATNRAGSASTSSLGLRVRYADVPANYLFASDIYWLSDHGLTTGFSDGTFRPTNSVTRQAFAAYLYRYAHSGVDAGKCAGGTSTFSDVPDDSQFCGDIAWMVANKITTGFSDKTFRPTVVVTRQAAAAFLYRYNHGGTDAGVCAAGKSAFPDVSDDNAFCGDIMWLASTSPTPITGGFPDGTFRPTLAVSRQAAAAQFHRYDMDFG